MASLKATDSKPIQSRPQVLLIDMDDGVTQTLRGGGFNVSSGSFGRAYRVQRGATPLPVKPNDQLADYAEADVVVVDVDGGEASAVDETEKVADGVESLWTSSDDGLIDPRPLAMKSAREKLDRVLNAGSQVSRMYTGVQGPQRRQD